MDGAYEVIAFYVLAALTLGSALGVMASRDLFHAVLLLIVTFVGIAGFFVLLSAEFLAMAQVVIYVGAISVLLLFAVLLIGNVFASLRVPNRLDTTESGFYTLEDGTRDYLAKLETPVNAYATLPEGGGRAIDDARRLLTAAQEVNPGKFKVKFLSLSLNKDEITRLKGKYPQADLNEYGILLTAGDNEERSAFIRESDLVKQEGGGVIMRVTTETIKISTGAIDPSVFAVPGDYKLITKKR